MFKVFLISLIVPFLVNAVTYVFEKLFDEWLDNHRRQKHIKYKQRRRH